MYLETIIESFILYITIASAVFFMLSRPQRKQYFPIVPLLILFFTLALISLIINEDSSITIQYFILLLFKLASVIYLYFISFNAYKKRLELSKEKRLKITTPYNYHDNSRVSNNKLESAPYQTSEEKRYKKSLLTLEEQLTIKGKIENYFSKNKNIYLDSEFSLSELSKQTGVSRQFLSQTFNLAMNTSFNNYINEKRINYACNELQKSPSISVVVLSEMCGYKSRASFYRHFMLVKNITLTEYKDMLLAD